MDIRDTVYPDKNNNHIREAYYEVFPRGTVEDLKIIASIPVSHKTASRYEAKVGQQSPLLVRAKYWDKHVAPFVKVGVKV